MHFRNYKLFVVFICIFHFFVSCYGGVTTTPQDTMSVNQMAEIQQRYNNLNIDWGIITDRVNQTHDRDFCTREYSFLASEYSLLASRLQNITYSNLINQMQYEFLSTIKYRSAAADYISKACSSSSPDKENYENLARQANELSQRHLNRMELETKRLQQLLAN